MQREPVAYDYHLEKTLAALTSSGLLLASTKRTGESNVMTIGWGAVGVIWGVPIFLVMVRPSRYTYHFIEDSGEFTVNVPSSNLREWVAICGSRSGREVDKFGAYGVKTTPGTRVRAVTIDDCPMVYECRVIHWNDVIPAHLIPEAEQRFYRGENYHRLYFGNILAAYASPDY